MNEQGVIDYQKPIGRRNDFRTSSYRGHFKLDEQMPIYPTRAPGPICSKFAYEVPHADPPKSEIQEQFTPKQTDPFFIRNPTTSGCKFMKPYEETHLRNAPKPLQAMGSTFKKDYAWKPKAFEEQPRVPSMPSAVEVSRNILINREKPGYAKFLDPSATTTNLAHKRYKPEDLGIAVKDAITFWNWNKQKYNVFKIKQTMCEMVKSSQCPKRRREFTSLLKPVPNRGLTTEHRSNYTTSKHGLNFDITHVKNKVVSCPVDQIKPSSSNEMYGSGKRIQEYFG